MLGIALGGGGAWLIFLQKHPPSSPPSEPADTAEAQPTGTVTLSAAQAKAVGITASRLMPRDVARELKGYGRVLDPTPLAGALAEIESAQAALEASRKEYDRAQALFARDQNVSARALETAEAAMKRDQAQLVADRTQLVGRWGQALAERPDLAKLVPALIAHEAALVRIDVAPTDALSSPPVGGRIESPGNESRSFEAEFIGVVPSADTQVQGQGFFCLIKRSALTFLPDMTVTGFLELGGEPLRGLVVPNSAVVRFEERAWVYVENAGTTFTRREVSLGHPLNDGWLVLDGIRSDERIVTNGAAILLSEEQKSRIKLAD
ncbi:MAG: hypothetical protein KGL35_21135 [Bradyrhizobium sp.]|nr:hypothetical protein [Bradyrhizobium sp.]